MNKSWSHLLLIMLVPSAQAVADNPIPIHRTVVSSTQNGTSTLSLAYLTPVADFNGELQVNGADLGMLLGAGDLWRAKRSDSMTSIRMATSLALTPDGQVGLCSVIEMLVNTLEGTQ